MGGLKPSDWPQQAVAFDDNGHALILLVLPGIARPVARRHARQALRQILGDLLKRAAENIVLYESKTGPLLDGASEDTSTRIRISLSYAEDRCLIGLSKEGALGVDIVRIEPIPEIETLSRLYLPAAVCRTVLEAAPAERDEHFALAWAQMEARSKCLALPLAEISQQRETALNECTLIGCIQSGAYRIALAEQQ